MQRVRDTAGDTAGDTAVIIPARDEGDRVAATVTAAMRLAGVGRVVVVDDGSTDRTRRVAGAAGARVVRHGRGRGKAAAMETGADAARLGAEGRGGAPRQLLFLDADLGGSACGAAPLLEPVREGRADMTVGLLPADRARGGGHGFVVRLSRAGVRRATGWEPEQPLSGQRCLTCAALEAARPLARGFGAETGLTVDLLRQGMRVWEVETPLAHRVTGSDWRGQLHRGRQFLDVARALALRPGR